jgi:hypothetical protein
LYVKTEEEEEEEGGLAVVEGGADIEVVAFAGLNAPASF